MKEEKEPPDWPDLDARHVWHPYTQMKTAPAPVPLERAEGVYLYDRQGRRILDGISSWWVNVHGHNHPRLNAALRRQLESLQQVIFAGFTHEAGARLAGDLIDAAPSGLSKVFYSDDGSTAVEVALKLCYQYWRNKGEDRRNLFVALEHAYHGDTFGAMAAGAVPVFHSLFADLFFEVQHIHSPYCRRCPVGLRREECRIECLHCLEQLLAREGERVVSVLIEPMVQGAGGMIIWPAEFLRQVRELTREYGIPLIADEVFTGFGRTGKLFACEHGPVSPDLLCLSKGLTGGYMPLAATLTTDRIFEAFWSDDRSRTFFHGHSFTANPLACAVARESLTLLAELGLGRILELETLFSNELVDLASLPIIDHVRNIGNLAVMELKTDRPGYLNTLGPELTATFLDRGLLLRPLGNVLYFLPPYTITDEEVRWVFATIRDVLNGRPSR